jgi:hypothetical protein
MRNARLTAVAVLALFVGAPHGYAQQTNPPTAPAAPSAPAPQAAAPSSTPSGMTDPKALEAANDLVKMVDSDAIYKSLFSIMSKSIMPMIARDNPNKTAEIQHIVIDSMSNAFRTHSAELSSNKAVIYARIFTYDELVQIIAFYKTPTGAKMLKSVPEVMEQSAQLNTGITMQIIKETQASVIAKLKQSGLKVPKEMGI